MNANPHADSNEQQPEVGQSNVAPSSVDTANQTASSHNTAEVELIQNELASFLSLLSLNLTADHAHEGEFAVWRGSSTELEHLKQQQNVRVIAGSVTVGNLVVQGVGAVYEAQALVQLSAETLQHLRTGSAVVRAGGGFNYGVLRNPATGQFVAQVKWAEAASFATKALGVSSVVFNALALAATQMQLNALLKQTQRIEQKIDSLSSIFRFALESELEASAQAISGVVDSFQIRQGLTTSDAVCLRGWAVEQDTHIRRLLKQLDKGLADWASLQSQSKRKAWFDNQAPGLLRDLLYLQWARGHWGRAQAVHIASLILNARKNGELGEQEEEIAAEIERARKRLLQIDREFLRCSNDFFKALNLEFVLHGRKRIGQAMRGPAVTVIHDKDTLDAAASELLNAFMKSELPYAALPTLSSDLTQFGLPVGEEPLPEWRSIIPLLLHSDEAILFVCHGFGAQNLMPKVGVALYVKNKWTIREPSLVVATTLRVLFLRKSQLFKDAKIQGSLKWSEIETFDLREHDNEKSDIRVYVRGVGHKLFDKCFSITMDTPAAVAAAGKLRLVQQTPPAELLCAGPQALVVEGD